MGDFRCFIGNDIELEIISTDINDFLKTIVYSFKKLVVDDDISSIEDRNLIVEILDENFPVDLFNDLIFLFDKDGFIGNEVEIKIINNKAHMILRGERVERKSVIRMLKAATYHGYIFKRNENSIYLKIIIDI